MYHKYSYTDVLLKIVRVYQNKSHSCRLQPQ